MEFKDLTKGSCMGTSFHCGIVKTTLNALISLLGYEHESGSSVDSKVQHYFERRITCADGEREKAIDFSIYDWKEYRDFGYNEEIVFHIGTTDIENTKIIVEYLKSKRLDARFLL